MRQTFFIAALSITVAAGVGQAADTFAGEIMDSQCAGMGSHDNMMKGEHASNAKECAIACVKQGGKYALYDPKAQKAYALDNQKKAAAFAGQSVTITGKMDSSSDSIHINEIQAK